MFSYHVTVGLDKKVINIMSKELTLIVDALQHAFSIASDNFVIQSWDADFDDWTNVVDASLLPDKGKLLILMKSKFFFVTLVLELNMSLNFHYSSLNDFCVSAHTLLPKNQYIRVSVYLVYSHFFVCDTEQRANVADIHDQLHYISHKSRHAVFNDFISPFHVSYIQLWI